MIRLAFWLSALFYLLAGLVFYLFPVLGVGGLLVVSPVWVGRLAGAVLIAWALQLFIASARPNGFAVAGLAAANLLVAATLVPATLRGLSGLPGALLAVPLTVCGVLVLLAVLALVLPRGERRY